MKNSTLHLPIQYFGEPEAQQGGEPAGPGIPSGQEPLAPAEQPNYAELLKTDKGLQSFVDGKIQTATQSAVQRALEKEQLLASEKATEAQKLAAMNEKEKQTYELKKAQNKIVELESRENVRSLREQALKLAGEKGVPSELAGLLPFDRMKAEEVPAQIEAVKGAYDKAVAAGVAQALSGAGTPAARAAEKQAYTKEEIERMSPDEINANWDGIKTSLQRG